ncbi:MAG: HAD family hydrolase [Candidatus Thorarchaeota archaeon]
MSDKDYSKFCVIFDMDGVLADTSSIHFESWVKLAEEIGITFTKSFFERTFGQQSPSIVRELVGQEADELLIRNWANLKEYYYRDMVKGKLRPLPGVLKIISQLKALGFKLAVGSSGPSENVELLLVTLQIKHNFDVVITAKEVQNGKPEPDVFIMAAKALNLPPENCIVIEDAPVGIKAARAAGMNCIALTTTHNEEELNGAQIISKNLTEISINDIINLFNK